MAFILSPLTRRHPRLLLEDARQRPAAEEAGPVRYLVDRQVRTLKILLPPSHTDCMDVVRVTHTRLLYDHAGEGGR